MQMHPYLSVSTTLLSPSLSLFPGPVVDEISGGGGAHCQTHPLAKCSPVQHMHPPPQVTYPPPQHPIHRP